MFNKKASKKIGKAIKGELAKNVERYGGYFYTNTDAYGVLKKELEGASAALDKALNDFGLLWDAIAAKKLNKKHIRQVRCDAVQAIKKLVQVAAMCDKWRLGVIDER